MVVAPVADNSGDVVSAEYTMSSYSYDEDRNEAQPFVANVRIIKQGHGLQTNKPLSFVAHSGQRLTFDADLSPTLVLTPTLINFRGAQVLALSTTISELQVGGGTQQDFTAYLDKGTVLVGVGTSMKLSLSTSVLADGNGNEWNLTGWSYGGKSGSDGQEWDDAGQSFTLTTDPSGSSPATTPYSFAVKGVLSKGTGAKYLSSDPVVRLSSVPPAGLSL